jgi:mutator protein MutT
MTKRTCAVLVPYRSCNGEFKFFLQKRTADAPRHASKYAFFGGGIEPGETIEQALRREIREELSIDISQYQYFGDYEGETSIHHIFIMAVADTFEASVTVCEGEYGKFYSLRQALGGIPIGRTNLRILTDISLYLGEAR